MAGAQEASPAAHTITATGAATAGGPVTGAVIMALVSGGKTDAPGLQNALRKAGIVDFVEDDTPLGHLPTVVGIRGKLASAKRADVDAASDAVKGYVESIREHRFCAYSSTVRRRTVRRSQRKRARRRSPTHAIEHGRSP